MHMYIEGYIHAQNLCHNTTLATSRPAFKKYKNVNNLQTLILQTVFVFDVLLSNFEFHITPTWKHLCSDLQGRCIYIFRMGFYWVSGLMLQGRLLDSVAILVQDHFGPSRFGSGDFPSSLLQASKVRPDLRRAISAKAHSVVSVFVLVLPSWIQT